MTWAEAKAADWLALQDRVGLAVHRVLTERRDVRPRRGRSGRRSFNWRGPPVDFLRDLWRAWMVLEWLPAWLAVPPGERPDLDAAGPLLSEVTRELEGRCGVRLSPAERELLAWVEADAFAYYDIEGEDLNSVEVKLMDPMRDELRRIPCRDLPPTLGERMTIFARLGHGPGGDFLAGLGMLAVEALPLPAVQLRKKLARASPTGGTLEALRRHRRRLLSTYLDAVDPFLRVLREADRGGRREPPWPAVVPEVGAAAPLLRDREALTTIFRGDRVDALADAVRDLEASSCTDPNCLACHLEPAESADLGAVSGQSEALELASPAASVDTLALVDEILRELPGPLPDSMREYLQGLARAAPEGVAEDEWRWSLADSHAAWQALGPIIRHTAEGRPVLDAERDGEGRVTKAVLSVWSRDPSGTRIADALMMRDGELHLEVRDPAAVEFLVRRIDDLLGPLATLRWRHQVTWKQVASEAEEDQVRDEALAEEPGRFTHDLQVTLLRVRPRVWRRVQVSSAMMVVELAEVVRRVTGWRRRPPHFFQQGPGLLPIGPVELLPPAMKRWWQPEDAVSVARLLPTEASRALFVHDRSAPWAHEVQVLGIEAEASPAGGALPTSAWCVEGGGACPPEECGGPVDLARLLAAWHAGDDWAESMVRRWLGKEMDPLAFDVEAANVGLGGLGMGPGDVVT